MKNRRRKTPKALHIGASDFMKANRRAARLEDIQAHGKPVAFRPNVFTSEKIYNRKRLPKIEMPYEN